MPEPHFQSRPLRARLIEAWVVALFAGVVDLALIQAIRARVAGPAETTGIALCLLLSVVVVGRALRIELVGDAEHITVRNTWRTTRIAWGDVTEIKIGWRSVALTRQPGLVIYRGRRWTTAAAFPKRLEEQRAVLKELAHVAPPSVSFPDVGASS